MAALRRKRPTVISAAVGWVGQESPTRGTGGRGGKKSIEMLIISGASMNK